MTSDIIFNQRKAYKENFVKEGPGPKGVLWNNTATQNMRFQKLIDGFSVLPASFTIHDVGCGTCDLHAFLSSKGRNHKYSGTEIVQEMIDYSKRKYPDIKIFNRDLLLASNNEKYDWVVLSGTFNLLSGISEVNWREYVYQIILKMYGMCQAGISFNFLTTYKTLTDPDLCYFNPLEMFDFCARNLSRFVSLNHSYPLFEATITVFKKDYVKETHSQIEFKKYFT